MKLTESILQKDSFECVGCIASIFQITVRGINEELKGQKIKAYIYCDGFEEDKVPLFTGVVDSVKMDSQKEVKSILAYDELYTKGQKDVASWYRSQKFPITLRDLRINLFTHLGIAQDWSQLPNDSIEIERQYKPETLQALPLIKAICQINGACGIIDRTGKFVYRFIPAGTGLFPSSATFPWVNTYPATDGAKRESLGVLYTGCSYEEFKVRPVTKLIIRDNDDDPGSSYGEGSNKYIIQGNVWALGLDDDTKKRMAKNIYNKVHGISYHPFTSENQGLPWVECGISAVSYSIKQKGAWKHQTFLVFTRNLSGIQILHDVYNARGEEDQREFITDLQTQIDALKRGEGVDLEDYYTKDEIDKKIETLPTKEATEEIVDEKIQEITIPTDFTIISVEALPTNPGNRTLYVVQGGVVIQ